MTRTEAREWIDTDGVDRVAQAIDISRDALVRWLGELPTHRSTRRLLELYQRPAPPERYEAS